MQPQPRTAAGRLPAPSAGSARARLRSLAVEALWLGAFIAAQFALAGAAGAEPWLPANDSVIVERLREQPRDDDLHAYKLMKHRLAARPDDAALAAATAQAAIGLARRDGDPRFLGAAEAALAPWRDRPDAPRPLRVLQAILLQANHDFDAALAALDAVLRSAPDDAQARLVRASVLQVQGRYDEAQRDLDRLADQPAAARYARAARAELASLRGEPERGAAELAALAGADLDARPGRAADDDGGWLALLDAEMSERRGDSARADVAFRRALVAGRDAYTLGAYADFLLDAGRPADAARLLDDHRRADALLLRLGIAWRALGDPRWQTARADLADRFAAARLRGDTVHRREEARFRLALADDPGAALALARSNWRVQREPADLRLLIDSAAACPGCDGADAALADARDFIARNRIADRRLGAFAATPARRPA
ncbi:tetratricopeptide repeat protein [Derxia lacustris]|uniref:tetratricopeptide repeat protein n=1 Tax=Derxia lacustris TaxID=764842 RepID=UPI00111BD696|nr:tetratricopeptide repeat protein [Derxia lacustris]